MESENLHIFVVCILSFSTILGIFHCLRKICSGNLEKERFTSISVSKKWRNLLMSNSKLKSPSKLPTNKRDNSNSPLHKNNDESNIKETNLLKKFGEDLSSLDTSSNFDNNSRLSDISSFRMKRDSNISLSTRPQGRYFHFFRREEFREKPKSDNNVNTLSEHHSISSSFSNEIEEKESGGKGGISSLHSKKRSNSVISASSQSSERFSNISMIFEDPISDDDISSLPPTEEIVIDECDTSSNHFDLNDSQYNIRKRKNLEDSDYINFGLKKRKIESESEDSDEEVSESSDILEQRPELGTKRPRPSELDELESSTLKLTGNIFTHINKRPRISNSNIENKKPIMFIKLIGYLTESYKNDKKNIQNKNLKRKSALDLFPMENTLNPSFRRRIGISNNQNLKQNFSLLHSDQDIDEYIRKTEKARMKAILMIEGGDKIKKLDSNLQIKKVDLDSKEINKFDLAPNASTETPNLNIPQETVETSDENTNQTQNNSSEDNQKEKKSVKFDFDKNQVFSIPPRQRTELES